MVRQLRRAWSIFDRNNEDSYLSKVLGFRKGGLDRKHNGEENNTGRVEEGRTFEVKGVFNDWHRIQRLPDPEKGEEYCSKCKGEGIDKGEVCEKCWGVGIVDWITNAMGKKPRSSGSSSSSGSSCSTFPTPNGNIISGYATCQSNLSSKGNVASSYLTSVSSPNIKKLWTINPSGPR
jgi:hypothetical protein